MLKAIPAFLFGLVVVFLILAGAVATPTNSARSWDDAAVKIVVKNGEREGNGSGVVLPGGYVLTAAHVMDKEGEDVSFSINGITPKLLWMSKDYDVALLRVDVKVGEPRHLACRDLTIGEEIWTSGFPLGVDVPITTRGIVSSKVAKFNEKRWNEFFFTDAVGDQGLSGGGVMDKNGKVVGIVVGSIGHPYPMMGLFVKSGHMIIVPSSTICKLVMR